MKVQRRDRMTKTIDEAIESKAKYYEPKVFELPSETEE